MSTTTDKDKAADKTDPKADKATIVSEPEKGQKTTTLGLAKVLILRSEVASISDDVFTHELPILRNVHGEEAVTVVSEDTVEVANFNANDEYARLQRKYKSDKTNAVVLAYRDARVLADELGVSYSPGEAKKPAKSTQTPAKKKVIGGKR